MDIKIPLLPNNGMSFSENQHGNAVLDKLRAQRENNRCCDVILIINGKQHHAHRCVLSACSPFFDSFFKAHKTIREQITIESESTEVVLTLLGYMYTGTVIIDKKNVTELLKLADRFLLREVRGRCIEYMQRYLDSRNCLTVWEISNKYGLETLQKNAVNHIATRLMEVLEGDEILDLSQLRLENFIKSSSNWQISNERILRLIITWVYHNTEERESGFRSLLTFILWKNISPDVVMRLVQGHPLFSTSRKCHAFVLDVLNENGLLCDPVYEKIANLRSDEKEKVNLEEENDNFINIAITTAINESNVEKYLLDSRKDLLREDLNLNESYHNEFRDSGQINSDLNSEGLSYYSRSKMIHDKNDSILQSVSNNIQTIDLEELCKYTLENTQKSRHYLNDSCDIDRVSPALKECDYDNSSYNDNQGNCFHYKDFREGDHFKSQTKSYPKFTNKISYMNHKYDLNHSNELSFNEANNPKNSSTALELNSPTYQLDFSKDGPLNLISGNYSDEHLSIHLNQEPQYHSVDPLSLVSGYKPDHFTVTDDIVPESKGANVLTDHNINLNSATYTKASSFIASSQPNVLTDHNINLNSASYTKASSFIVASQPNILTDHNINLNSASYTKASSLIASSQAEFLYMDCSNDTQSSNNYPKDMSLPHLKLSECQSETFYQNSNNAYEEITPNGIKSLEDTDIGRSHEVSFKDIGKNHEDFKDTDIGKSYKVSFKDIDIEKNHEVSFKDIGKAHDDSFKDANIGKSYEISFKNIDVGKSHEVSFRDINVRKNHEDFNDTNIIKIHETSKNMVIDKNEEYYFNNTDIYRNHEGSSKDMEIDKCHDTSLKISSENYVPDCEQDKQTPYSLRNKAIKKESGEFIKKNVNHQPTTNSPAQFKDNANESNQLQDKSTIKADDEESNTDDNLARSSKRIKEKKIKKGIRKPAAEKPTKKKKIEPAKAMKACEFCDATFVRKKEYFGHIIEQHFPGPPFVCDTCGKNFKRIYHLLDHRITHSEKKSFSCSLCSFSTHKMFNLKEHMSLHTMDRPFKCDECGDSFVRKQHLEVHKTKHTDEKPIVCKICGWATKTKNSLVTHSKIHTGDLYSCQYSDCPYKTAKKCHLKEHLQTHTKSRPFECKICDLRFMSKPNIMRHIRIHEAPNLYECDNCDYCCSRFDALKIHVKRKHNTTLTKSQISFLKARLKKKKPSLLNKKIKILPANEQPLLPNLNNSNGRLSPLLSESFSQYSTSPSQSPFGASGDPDDPLTIVSEIEDNQSPYIGQAFSGLLDSSCGADRFALTANEELYYN